MSQMQLPNSFNLKFNKDFVRAARWSPSSLFASGEVGAWYDPSDLSTLFQDSAGTTPVTAAGQSVGLVLDKSKGLTLGPERATNGNFDADTDWTKSAQVTIAGGVLNILSSDGSYQQANQNMALVVGATYRIDIAISRNAGGSLRFSAGSGSYGNISAAVGSHQLIFVATGSTLYIERNAGVTDIDVTSISVRLLPGYHASQPTAASRPTYGTVPSGGRRNLLTYSEQFDNAAWTALRMTVSANAGVAPDGTTTADKLIPTAVAGAHTYGQSYTSTIALTYNYSFSAKADGYNFVQVIDSTGIGVSRYATLNLATGVVGNSSGFTPTVQAQGDGWYRISVSGVSDGAAGQMFAIAPSPTDAASRAPSYTGDGTSGILIWGAQLELGSTATAYQRVGSAFDITESGATTLHYLSFDGSDDFLVTGTITPGVDKAQVFAGVQKLGDPIAGAILAEMSTDSSANAGTFGIFAPSASLTTYGFRSRGTAAFTPIVSGAYAAPVSSLVTGTGDISGDAAAFRINGSQEAQSTADQGTGNYLAYPLFIGRRGGTSLPFNGNLFGLVVRFSSANLDNSKLILSEQFMARKTGVIL